MLIVLAEAVVEDGAVARVQDALRTMEQETRKEEGCLGYAFSVDVNDATMMRITERWRSMDDLRAHFATPHMAAFGQAIGEVQPKSLEVKVYEIAQELELPR